MSDVLFNLALSLIMVFCIILDIAAGTTWALGLYVVALVMDVTNTVLAFRRWRKEKNNKE